MMSKRYDISNPVFKPWGYEFEYFDNGQLSIWVLHLGIAHKSGYLEAFSATSMHFHKHKDAVALCVDGVIEVRSEHESIKLKTGDHVFLKAGLLHQLYTDFPNSVLIEIEKPSDRADIIRINDAYGRETTGYTWNTQPYLNPKEDGFALFMDTLQYKCNTIIERFKGEVDVLAKYPDCFILLIYDNRLRLLSKLEVVAESISRGKITVDAFILRALV